MQRLLFLCGRNRARSPTAEQLFTGRPGLDVASAGVSPDAEELVTPELLAWADLVLVMERRHQQRLKARFGPWLKGTRVVCLDIADRYTFMQAELVTLLEQRVAPHLTGTSRRA